MLMLGGSPELIAALAGNYTPLSALRIIRDDGSPIVELTDKTADASVSADNSAATLRTLTATIAADDITQVPESFASDLGPTSRVQTLRGARVQNVVTVGELVNTQAGWNTFTTPVGINNGVIGNSSGELVLGYV